MSGNGYNSNIIVFTLVEKEGRYQAMGRDRVLLSLQKSRDSMIAQFYHELLSIHVSWSTSS